MCPLNIQDVENVMLNYYRNVIYNSKYILRKSLALNS